MILAVLTALALPMQQDPAPGIDRELARSRKLQVHDIEYDLRFQLAERNDEVSGTVFLRFRLDPQSDPVDVVLDFDGRELSGVMVNGQECQLRLVNGHAIVPADLLEPGLNGLKATFRASVAPTGTPLTVYRDAADGRDYYYTLLVPADAHRLFPCFDQPDLRARFRLELDLPPAWTAVTNTAPVDPDDPAQSEVLGRQPEASGKLWRFGQSKPLPTYLFAFACGPFAEIRPPHPAVAGITTGEPMRILLRGSRLGDLDRDTLVKLHHGGLAWLQSIFDVPYPFDKLDLVLLPGFPYGGMEHAGAIFYRESAMVFDHPPTASEQVRRSTLVYHELSHQWFGNLVTMKWFDDLWLKEGFATFYAYRALAALEPGQRAWLRFLQDVKPRAYAVDGTPGTTPVFQELQNLADAKSAYGAIVYNKAPAVLRALFAQLGERAFQIGVKSFLERHAFDNADWQDLAASLEGAARSDLGRWSARWLLAPSMPQVRIEWQADADGTITSAAVVQRALHRDGAADESDSEASWPIDLELLVFDEASGNRSLTIATDAPRTEIEALVGKPAPAAILANPQDVAYGQFVPDATSRAWLLAHVAREQDPMVRAAATAALYEAVREAELDPSSFAELTITLLAGERDPDTHGWLLDRLATCICRFLTDARAAPLRASATDLLLRQLAEEADSGREFGTFRFLARNSTDGRVLQLCRDVIADARLPAGLAPGKQDCFLAAAALIAAGKASDELDRLQRRFDGQDLGKELFLARAATPSAVDKQRYYEQYMQLETPPEQWTQDSLSWFHWPGQEELTRPFLARALERLQWVKQNRRIFFMPAWLDAFVNGHSSEVALRIVDEFAQQNELPPDIRQKLLQSRDGLARAVRIRERFAVAAK